MHALFLRDAYCMNQGILKLVVVLVSALVVGGGLFYVGLNIGKVASGRSAAPANVAVQQGEQQAPQTPDAGAVHAAPDPAPVKPTPQQATTKPVPQQTTPTPSAPSAPSAPATGGDQLGKLLVSSAWCSFWYNNVSGASGSTRFVYSANGTFSMSTGGESYSSGYGGTYAGQSGSSASGKWKTENNQLSIAVAESGWQYINVPLQYKTNSNGAPILVADGEEYAQCR